MQTDLFKKSAILVNQKPLEGLLYSDILSANGFDVYIAKSVMDALLKIKEKSQDLVLLDLDFASQNFVEKFIKKLKDDSQCKNTAIVGLSVYNREDQGNLAHMLDGLLTKPCSIDKFITGIFSSIENVNGRNDSAA